MYSAQFTNPMSENALRRIAMTVKNITSLNLINGFSMVGFLHAYSNATNLAEVQATTIGSTWKIDGLEWKLKSSSLPKAAITMLTIDKQPSNLENGGQKVQVVTIMDALCSTIDEIYSLTCSASETCATNQ